MKAFAFGVATALACSSPAAAVTTVVSGTIEPDPFGYIYVNGPTPPIPGVYKFSFALSRPGIGSFEIAGLNTYNFYGAEDGVYYGGNDVPYSPIWFYDDPVSSDSFLYKLPRDYTSRFAEFIEYGFYYAEFSALSFTFEDSTPVSYTITSQFLSAIPEPSTWALMLIGFFAVGHALRRREALRFAA